MRCLVLWRLWVKDFKNKLIWNDLTVLFHTQVI